MSLALSTLLFEWRRYMAAVMALALSGLLVLAMTGVFIGIGKGFTATIERSSADIIIMQPGAKSLINGPSGVPRRFIPLAYNHPEVVEVKTLDMSGGNFQNIKNVDPTATAADRLIGFAVLLLMATGGLLVHALSGRLPSNGLAVVGALGLCVILVGAGFAALPWLASKLPAPWARPLRQIRGDIRGTLLTTALSAGVWILDFASGWVLARALGLSLGPVEVGSALAVAYTSALLPISLGGHGVREGALVLTLLWIAPDAGLAANDLSAFALLFLATSLACSAIGGLVLLAGRGSSARR
jgi:hypothetical protein